MKTGFLLFVLGLSMFYIPTLKAQQGIAINVTGAAADVTAILDVSSDSKGMLIPRMNNAQRTTISNPANGLIVFDTDCPCFYFFISTGPSTGAWRKLIDESSSSTLTDADGDSYLTLNYDNSDDDTIRLFFNDTEKYKISSKAIEQLNNSQSLFIGEGAGRHIDGTSIRNTFIGYYSGYQTVNTPYNTGVGAFSLAENSGTYNTAVGSSALRYHTTGNYNTAIGMNSQSMGTTGSRNTSIGYYSLLKSRGQMNVAAGERALANDTTGTNNTAVGSESMYNNASGTYNSALGSGSLYNNTIGSGNVAIGYNSSFGGTTATDNIAIGSHALFQNMTSSGNIAIGSGALYDLGTGTENIAIGTSSMNMADIGSNNTAVGTWTLYYNEKGSANTVMGYHAMALDSSGSNNTAVGFYTMYRNKKGRSNVAMGPYALFSNTESGHLVAIGDSALYFNGTNASEPEHASRNTAVGSKALYANTSGRNNTAVGFEALKNTTTGIENMASGTYALYTNSTGSGNTAGGYYSLYGNSGGAENTAMGFHSAEYCTGNYNSAFGTYALMSDNAGGDENTAIGGYALSLLTSGDNNTALGYEAGSQGNHTQCTFIGSKINTYTNRTNVTIIGYGIQDAQCTGNNQVLLGNTAISQVRAQVTSITAYSDGRMKSNISENVPGLEFIIRLRPVTYNENPEILHQIWGTPAPALAAIDHSLIKQQRFIGFVAQDVEKAARECGFDFPGIDIPRNDHEAYALRYGDFIMPVVKAIQEQQDMIAVQGDLISKLQTEIEALKAIVADQSRILNSNN